MVSSLVMHTLPQVVVVEDYDLLQQELVHALQADGYATCGVSNGRELDLVLQAAPVRVIVLDINLPEEDGFSIAARLRQHAPDLGILMLSARAHTHDKTDGYRAGADMYLTKPVSPDELSAAVARLLTRLSASAPARQWQLSTQDWLLSAPNGRCLTLSAREFVFLQAIAHPPVNVHNKQQLAEYVLACHLPNLAPRLDVLVARLRKKAHTSLGVPLPIKTVHGMGYALSVSLCVTE